MADQPAESRPRGRAALRAGTAGALTQAGPGHEPSARGTHCRRHGCQAVFCCGKYPVLPVNCRERVLSNSCRPSSHYHRDGVCHAGWQIQITP